MKIFWLLHKALDRLVAVISDTLTGNSSTGWYCPSCGYPGDRRLPHFTGDWAGPTTICHTCLNRFGLNRFNDRCMNCPAWF